MAKVQVLCGAHRSQRCAQIDQVMRNHWGRSLLLTPTHGYARVRRERLLLTGGGAGMLGESGTGVQGFCSASAGDGRGCMCACWKTLSVSCWLEQALAGEMVAEKLAALNLSNRE